MSNELIKESNMPTSAVQQKGEKNLNINNNDGGTINIYNVPHSSQLTNTTETLIAIQNFSRDYYHLIITGDEISSCNSLVMSADRSLTKESVSDEIYDKFASLSETAIEDIKKYPAIICNENTAYYGDTDLNQMAIYAYIDKVKIQGNNIKIYFVPIDIIPQKILNVNPIDFGINISCAITTLNRTQWTMKKIDLFEAFKDVGLNLRSPI